VQIDSVSSVLDISRGALAATLEAVAQVTPDDLHRPTPCARWDVESLLRHMTGQHRGFATSARGVRPQRQDFAPALDADPIAGYRAASEQVEQAFAGVTSGDVLWLPELSEERAFPAPLAVGFHTIDYVIHAWDVARSVGYHLAVPDSVVEPALNLARSLPAPRGPGGPFLTEIEISPGMDPLDQLLAWSGRNPAA
jgi:uncharacterized protein (TIGR03086 family)